jgi:hypothetical protein
MPVNYNAKTGDSIELKTTSGWVAFFVIDSYPNFVSIKDSNGSEFHYSYDRIIQMQARFI